MKKITLPMVVMGNCLVIVDLLRNSNLCSLSLTGFTVVVGVLIVLAVAAAAAVLLIRFRVFKKW